MQQRGYSAKAGSRLGQFWRDNGDLVVLFVFSFVVFVLLLITYLPR
jgi:hypothetical protein